MSNLKVSGALMATALATLGMLASRTASAQQPTDQVPPPAPAQGAPGQGAPGQSADYDDYGPAGATQENPIPPNVEGQPVMAGPAGGYCYVGPHPVDTRVMPGPAFDTTQGQHVRPYGPVDMRLFSLRGGCYYFIGDPRDFGYTGPVYSYYGAHPVADTYGGGWCFMMGGHYHLWRPWSPYFTVVGPWSYWYGPYDPFFWSYWPYYSFYYRSYYPNYYAGGRFYRGGNRVAPPISRVPATAWRGAPPGGAGGLRGAPPAGGGIRGVPPAAAAGRGAAPAAGGWRGAPASYAAPARSAPSPHFSGGGFRGHHR